MTTSGKTGAEIGSSEVVFAAVARNGDAARELAIVVIGGRESELVARATERGLTPLLASDDLLDDAIARALDQVAELDRLRTVSARVAQVERAKGILMERHKLSERDAHERMRRHARNLNVKLAVVAEAIEDSYLLISVDEP